MKCVLYIQAQIVRVNQPGRTWTPHPIPRVRLAGHKTFWEDKKDTDTVLPVVYHYMNYNIIFNKCKILNHVKTNQNIKCDVCIGSIS